MRQKHTDSSNSIPVNESFFPLLRSPNKQTTTMKLLHIDNHLCFIKDIDQATHSFACAECKKVWKEEKLLKCHEKSCEGGQVRFTYPGAALEKLYEQGIPVDTNFIYPYQATYDFVFYFDQTNLSKTKTSQTVYKASHDFNSSKYDLNLINHLFTI